MYKHIFSVALIVCCALFTGQSKAQSKEDSVKVEERIILKKEGTFPNDLTLHIHGDKVTINGKEPKDIDVIREKSSDKERRFKSFHPSFKGNKHTPAPHTFSFGNAPRGARPLLGVLTRRNDEAEGAKITEVEKGTAADSAGLEKGDVIIDIDQQKIASAEDLSRTIARYKPGEKIKVTFLRKGQQEQLSLTLGRIGGRGNYGAAGLPDFGRPFGRGRFPSGDRSIMEWFKKHHPQLLNGSPQFKKYGHQKGKLGVIVENNAQPEGAKIVHISPNSVASKAGFKENDVITKFGKYSIHSIQDLKKAIQQNRGEKHIKTVVQREKKKEILYVSLKNKKERAQL